MKKIYYLVDRNAPYRISGFTKSSFYPHRQIFHTDSSIFNHFDDPFFVIIGYWVFGAQFCDTWVAFDVMCSTASILNLCAISLDRYIHIKDPLR